MALVECFPLMHMSDSIVSRFDILTWDESEDVVVCELQKVYTMNASKIDVDRDSHLLQSLDTVLQYYMSEEAYNEWKQNENCTLL